MGVPCIEMSNAHPDFAWTVQWLECIMQSFIFGTCNWATVGHKYRTLANEFYEKTTDRKRRTMRWLRLSLRNRQVPESYR